MPLHEDVVHLQFSPWACGTIVLAALHLDVGIEDLGLQ